MRKRWSDNERGKIRGEQGLARIPVVRKVENREMMDDG